MLLPILHMPPFARGFREAGHLPARHLAGRPPRSRVRPLLCLAVLALTWAGCASPSGRIQQNEARFNSYTPAEKRLIRMGDVAVGFDPEQVRMALGEPSRERTVSTASGKQIVWEYREIRPAVGLSFGGGIRSGGKGSVGTGVGVHASPDRTKLLKRIVFDRQTGNVARIDTYE